MSKEHDDDDVYEDRCLFVTCVAVIIVSLSCVIGGSVLTAVSYTSEKHDNTVQRLIGPALIGAGVVGVASSLVCLLCCKRYYDDDSSSTTSDHMSRPDGKGTSYHSSYGQDASSEYTFMNFSSAGSHSPYISEPSLHGEGYHRRARDHQRQHHHHHHFQRRHSHQDGKAVFHEVAALEQYLSSNPELRRRWENMASGLRSMPRMAGKLEHFRQKLAVDPVVLTRLVSVMKQNLEDPDECQHQIVDLVEECTAKPVIYRRGSVPSPRASTGSPIPEMFMAYPPPFPEQGSTNPGFYREESVFDASAYEAAAAAAPDDVSYSDGRSAQPHWVRQQPYPMFWDDSYTAEYNV